MSKTTYRLSRNENIAAANLKELIYIFLNYVIILATTDNQPVIV